MKLCFRSWGRKQKNCICVTSKFNDSINKNTRNHSAGGDGWKENKSKWSRRIAVGLFQFFFRQNQQIVYIGAVLTPTSKSHHPLNSFHVFPSIDLHFRMGTRSDLSSFIYFPWISFYHCCRFHHCWWFLWYHNSNRHCSITIILPLAVTTSDKHLKHMTLPHGGWAVYITPPPFSQYDKY